MPRERFDLKRVLQVVLGAWPEGIVEDDGNGRAFPLRDAVLDQTWQPNEFFIYRDQASADVWTEEGYTEENRGRMLHVLIGNHVQDEIELTLVVDVISPQTNALVDGIAQALSVENGALRSTQGATKRST